MSSPSLTGFRQRPSRARRLLESLALAAAFIACGLDINPAHAHDKQWRQGQSLSKTELTFPSEGELTPYYSQAAQAPGMSVDVLTDCHDGEPGCEPTWRLSGTFTTAPALKALMEDTLEGVKGNDVRRLILDSQGGGVEAAMWLATIVEMAGMDTEVDDDGTCVSACVYVLSAGRNRTVGKWAVVAVHQQNTTSSLVPESIRAQGGQEIERHLQGQPSWPAAIAAHRMDLSADLIQRSTGWWVAQTLRTGVSPMLVSYATTAPFPFTGGTILPLTHSCMAAMRLDNQTHQGDWILEDVRQACEH